jgi:hypothetical protein
MDKKQSDIWDNSRQKKVLKNVWIIDMQNSLR